MPGSKSTMKWGLTEKGNKKEKKGIKKGASSYISKKRKKKYKKDLDKASEY